MDYLLYLYLLYLSSTFFLWSFGPVLCQTARQSILTERLRRIVLAYIERGTGPAGPALWGDVTKKHGDIIGIPWGYGYKVYNL